MQKNVLMIITSAFIVMCGMIPAKAQQQPGDSHSSHHPDQQETQQQPSNQENSGMMGQGGMMGGGMMHDRMMGGREDSYHHHMGMGGRARAQQGATFRFRRGDAMIDIRCPKDEELSTCVQGAIRLMREVKSMQGTSSPTAPSVNPPAATPSAPSSPESRQ